MLSFPLVGNRPVFDSGQARMTGKGARMTGVVFVTLVIQAVILNIVKNLVLVILIV